jgi:arsenate reductase
MNLNKISVLFVCIHNSARSQMAEAFLKHIDGEHFAAESAGLEPGTLNPLAVEAMKEVGIDISRNPTKDAFELYKQGRTYNYVVTVCDAANSDRCPVFPGVTIRLHWFFDDPSAFTGSHEEKLAKTREVRDAIEKQVEQFIADVKAEKYRYA